MNKRAISLLCIIIAAITWGSVGVFVNFINLPPAVIVFFRTFFGAIGLLPIILIKFERFVEGLKNLKFLIAIGIILAIHWTIMFYALILIPIGVAVLIDYIAPVLVAVFAFLMLKERIKRETIISLIIAMFGIFLISSHGIRFEGLNPIGIVFAFLSALLYALIIIMSKFVLKGINALTLAFYSYIFSSATLSPILVNLNFGFSLETWILLIFLGIINSSFAFMLYLYGLKNVKAQEAAVLTYLEPVSALFFGFIFLSQKPTLITIIGGLLILIAGYVVTIEKSYE